MGMTRDIHLLADRCFDLLIVGGGIFGAGIARDAMLRGLSVAIVDKGDWAGETSSRSSKLIHGGFRYLEQGAWRLVAESCRERRILQNIAPDRVKPIPFLLPVYDGDARPLWKMRIGMTLYDLLALYQNTAAHRTVSAAAARHEEESLSDAGLRGAIRYFDCQEDDARFCIDHVIHAASMGAVAANYCEVAEFQLETNRIVATRVKDLLGSTSFDVKAHVVVNAAGPWVERVAALSGTNLDGLALGPTKGVHLLLPKLTARHAIAFQARRDGRILFILPWHDCSIVGTTDTDFAADPATARAEQSNVDYLLAEVNGLMPERKIGKADVITTFAGVRPLLRSSAQFPSSRGREHRIVRQGENLISVAGGKYTTYRAVAKEVVDRVFALRGWKAPACRTHTTPLPNSRPALSGEKITDRPAVFESDVIHACANEMAITVSDVMRRRTPLALSRYGGEETARHVAKIMGREMHWDGARQQRSTGAYLAERKMDAVSGS